MNPDVKEGGREGDQGPDESKRSSHHLHCPNPAIGMEAIFSSGWQWGLLLADVAPPQGDSPPRSCPPTGLMLGQTRLNLGHHHHCSHCYC